LLSFWTTWRESDHSSTSLPAVVLLAVLLHRRQQRLHAKDGLSLRRIVRRLCRMDPYYQHVDGSRH